MKVEVGQVWYDYSDDHVELVVKIDEDLKKVGVVAYDDGDGLRPITLEYSNDPMDVYEDEDMDFHLATTMEDILEICKNERRKAMHKV
jgi:hypothetical protein